MRKQKAIAVLLMLGIVLGLTACGGGANNDAEPDTSGDPMESAGPVKDSVTIAAAAEPDCFFPFHTTLTTNMDEVPILHNIYETPIKLMPDGSLEPLLAESWDVSEDGLNYTLHLRSDVKFSDGNPMTAEDVAFTLNGAAATTGGQSQLINFDIAEAADDHTVVVHLTAPYAPFINALACRFALVVEKALFEELGEDGYNEAPVGTGPYAFVERVAGDKIILMANENYWGGVPAIKNVTYKVMSDANTQMLALENGEIDVLLNANITPLTRLPEDSNISWLSTEASSITALGFNCAKGPATDINFRKALQCAINKEEVNIGAYEGMASIGDIFMTSAFSGRPDDEDIAKVEYDLEKAQEYLDASDYSGEEFMIVAVSGTKDEAAAQIIQGQLIQLGINCTVNAIDAASYMALVYQGDGSWGGAIRAGGVSLVDADGLYMLFHTNPAMMAAGYYDAGCNTPELDALLDAGRIELVPENRKDIYADAVNYITENAYQIVLYYNQSVVAFDKNIQGVVPSVLTGLYFINDWNW